MIKILFVCHGNICRSPMAEFVMRDMVQRAGLSDKIEAASAATSREELGNPVYPPVVKILTRMGIDCGGKRARQIVPEDYDSYDLIIGMDSNNLRNMRRVFRGEWDGRIKLLLDYTDHPRDVADPWYTRDFEACRRDVEEGCAALLEELISSGRAS
ncbi:MAG: low molecular weight phosphotyrosine protein phosphatase [Oscillospiraceae bacterium]|nr:low molecular weight phosphotyrosine protein phosphatase [Oscillospiraceae bacterium]